MAATGAAASPASALVRTIRGVLGAIGVGTAAGLFAGAIAGGVGSRLAMRVSALTSDGCRQLITENENRCGEITLGGSLGLFVGAAVFVGVAGGLLFMLLRPWFPGSGWRRGGLFGLALLAFAGAIIESGNRDFRLFGLPLLNVLMFAALFPLFGVLVGAATEWIERRLPAASPREALRERPLVTLAVAVGAALGALFAGGIVLGVVGTSVEGDPGALAALGVLALVPLTRWWLARGGGFQRPSDLRGRPRDAVIAYVVLGVPALTGLTLTAREVWRILEPGLL